MIVVGDMGVYQSGYWAVLIKLLRDVRLISLPPPSWCHGFTSLLSPCVDGMASKTHRHLLSTWCFLLRVGNRPLKAKMRGAIPASITNILYFFSFLQRHPVWLTNPTGFIWCFRLRQDAGFSAQKWQYRPSKHHHNLQVGSVYTQNFLSFFKKLTKILHNVNNLFKINLQKIYN